MKRILATDLMTREVLTVRDDLRVSELAEFLADNEITGAPVTDAGGKIVGVVSVVDVARADSERAERTAWDAVGLNTYRHEWEERLKGEGLHVFHLDEDGVLVRDIMNSSVHSVAGDATVAEIARQMLQFHLHRLLVIEEGRLTGIISTSDLLRLFAEED